MYSGSEYHKFSGKGALWNSITTGSYSSIDRQGIYTLGDTVEFNGIKYLQVNNFADGIIHTVGALREDTLTKKIYYKNDIEVLMYDFSLNKGDTIFYREQYGNPKFVYYKVVDSIGSIELNGELRKKWYLTTSMHQMEDVWIEGIGSVFRYGLLNPIMPEIPTNGSSTYFGCFKYGDISYFNRKVTNSSACPCSEWLVHVPEVKSESEEIKLYPIPTMEILNINLGNTNYDFFEIYTCNSKLIAKTKIDFREIIELNLENFEKGFYFIKFSGKDNISLKKIVKL